MSVQVAVRSRPLNRDETDCGSSIIVRMNQGQVEVINSSQGQGQKFNFDHALWSTDAVVPGNKNPVASQESVFEAVGRQTLEHTFTGYNSCIFAYGQTGSGKTYSMMGSASDLGLVPRIASHIFELASQQQANGAEVCVEVSFLEIYNERVRCLLNPSKQSSADGSEDTHPLRVREHPVHGPYVEGLAKLVVTSKEQFLNLMNDGNKLRTTAATLMNATSSRSHALFQVAVTQKLVKGSVQTTTKSKMNLVDLAGSERATKTNATGARLTEGANINKSLSALGLVISNLAEEFESGKQRHIPYRDSVLTWILKDNLGGNSKTVMLAAISPASAQYEETMSTLRYAERAKKIQNKAQINQSNNNEVVAALQKEIEALRMQLKSTADADKRGALAEQLEISEAFEHELAQSLEQKLQQTNSLMAEREAKMAQLQVELDQQKHMVENLSQINSEKDKKIADLLGKIAERETSSSKTSTSVHDEIDRLRLQIAELEVQRDEEDAKEKARQKEAANARLRQEDLGNVGAAAAGASGKVSVRALARAFESHGNVKQEVKKTVNDVPEPKRLPHILQQALAKNQPAATTASSAATTSSAAEPELELEEENILENLEDDIQVDEPAVEDQELDDDVAIDDDDDIALDDEEPAAEAAADDDEIAVDDEEPGEDNGDLHVDDDEIELEDEEHKDDDGVELDDDDIELDEGEGAAAVAVEEPVEVASPTKVVKSDDVELASSEAHHVEPTAQSGASTSADIDQPINKPAAGGGEESAQQQRARAQTITAKKAATTPAAAAPTGAITALAIPSHALPNNRFLREPFKVIKIDEGALIGGKKERIWDVDFFGKKFANLDMTGYESFSQPSSNLFRVEKDQQNSKKLTMYFFDAAHPYDLEFTSTERRQRFYELAMLQRRNSIMWCPSLCPEGENDVILNIQGTTIDRPNGKVVKAKGEVKFMIARMPYEVIDLYYGCFSLQEKPLPRSAAMLASFIPRTMHEVYVIGVTDVPKELIGNAEIANYLLSYLGPSMYFVLANTAVDGKTKTSNNVMVVIVRRSFIVRVSHIEAMEIAPVRKEGVTKTDFTGVGCSMKINECSIGVILINANPAVTDPTLRAGCIRGLMANLPFGNTQVDIGARFDYLICSGSLGFRGDFTEADMLKKQMKAGNVMSDFGEAEPHASLTSTTNPIRILSAVRPRVCRMDVKQYQTSRAMSVPNSFITADIFCQRAFLSTFGEQVPRTQFIFTSLSVLGHRIPHINSADIVINGDWAESSPLVVPITKQGESYVATGKVIPPIVPVVSNFDFLRLQSLSFTIMAMLPASRDKKKIVIASATLPLKNSFSLGEAVDFSVPLYYRGCTVGFLNGSILQVHAEKNDADMQSAGLQAGERDAHVVSCFENQIVDAQGTWVSAMNDAHSAFNWSSAANPSVEARRESFQLPDADKWKWLTQWRHEARADNVDGWTYSSDFKSPFEVRKSKAHHVRRRRWTRVMQAEDALTLHAYLESLHKQAS